MPLIDPRSTPGPGSGLLLCVLIECRHSVLLERTVIEPCQIIGAHGPTLDKPGQVPFEDIEPADPDLRRPAVAHLVKERPTDRHHFVATGCHLHPLTACVIRVDFPDHISELL